MFPDHRNGGGTCSQLYFSSLATEQDSMEASLPCVTVEGVSQCPESSPGPRPGQCLDPSIQSPPYTSPHHHNVIYTFFSRLFPLYFQHNWVLVWSTWMSCTYLCVVTSHGIMGVGGQAAAAQQLGFLGKQTQHQSWTTGYQRHTSSEGQGRFTYPCIISLSLLQFKCLNKKFFDTS